MSKLTLAKADETATPATGKADLYIKLDGTLAVRNENGTESIILQVPRTDKIGFFDYNNAGANQSHTGSGGFVKLTNDELGSFTNKTYKPDTVTDVWDKTLNQFDFTDLALGDMVDIRVDVEVTTTTANQDVSLQLELGIGGVPYTLQVDFISPKTAGFHRLLSYTGIYMGDTNTLNNPGEVQLDTDASLASAIKVNGWYIKIIRR